MKEPVVEMLIPPEVAEILCNIDPKYRIYLRADKNIAVRLKKALYGCVQSAMLWYEELTSTLQEMGLIRNPYDTCSFSRLHPRLCRRFVSHSGIGTATPDYCRKVDV